MSLLNDKKSDSELMTDQLNSEIQDLTNKLREKNEHIAEINGYQSKAEFESKLAREKVTSLLSDKKLLEKEI